MSGAHGPRLGRYQLLRRLASGGTAEVLTAQVTGSSRDARPYALKRLLPQLAENAEARRMLDNEARLLALFEHPNIVRFIDSGTDALSGHPYLVMELIEGLDLRALLRERQARGARVASGVAARIMIGVLEGLGYAHQLRGPDGRSMQVVHRDLSPQNIVVSTTGVPKLIDFGVVKAEVNEGDTKTGQLKGSVAYMAPEQIGGRALDGRADLFSVGVCLFELVTGVNPFRRSTELATFNALLDEQPGPMNRWAPDCPAELEEVVRGAIAKHRDGRYRSAHEMRVALERVPGLADEAAVAREIRAATGDTAAQASEDDVVPLSEGDTFSDRTELEHFAPRPDDPLTRAPLPPAASVESAGLPTEPSDFEDKTIAEAPPHPAEPEREPVTALAPVVPIVQPRAPERETLAGDTRRITIPARRPAPPLRPPTAPTRPPLPAPAPPPPISPLVIGAGLALAAVIILLAAVLFQPR